jgi:hypothetical protein
VTRIASGPVLLGFLAFAASTTAPSVAFGDGTEVVAAVAPETPPPLPPDTAPAPTATKRSTQLVAIALAGVAVVGAGSGTAFGVLALNDKSSFDAHPTFHAGNSASENAVLSDVCFGGAVVAAITSVILFVKVARTPPDGEPRASDSAAPPAKSPTSVSFMLSPLITSHGGGAGAALRF